MMDLIWLARTRADPVLGVMSWDTFMASVKVVAWVQGEPRKMVPVSIISLILDDVDLNEFMDVQMAFLILLCLYTYSRSESPCPKSHTGRESYDEEEHMNVKDIDAEVVDGKRCLKARFRKTKVDPRVQRPEAQGDGDWSIIGDVDDPKWSIVEWYTKLQRFHGHRADTRAPFFIEQANPGRGARPLIYRVALAAFKDRQRRVGVSDEDLAGLHGLRVAGWNGTKDVLGPELAQAHGGWTTKVDPRVQRPEAQGDGDWSIIGDVDDPKWSIVEWYTKLQRFHGHRADTRAPFFIEQANPGRGARPLIYRVALAAFKDRQRRVGVSDEDLAGLHGLRVAGWNGTKDVLGPELAQAHGGWTSVRGCTRYSRFALSLVAQIPSAIVGKCTRSEPDDEDSEGGVRAAGPPPHRLQRADLRLGAQAGSSPAAAQPPDAQNSLPEGWREVVHDGPHLARSYKTYSGPGGVTASSRSRAWQLAVVATLDTEETPGEAIRAEVVSIRGSERGSAPSSPDAFVPPPASPVPVEDLSQHVTYFDRALTGRPRPRFFTSGDLRPASK